MGTPRTTLRGRGAAHNPPNRFVPIEVVADEWIDEESPPPDTRYFKDASRSIIATNDSPDVGFEASVNPYRGCTHGCSFCLSGATPILMADGTTRALADLCPGDRIYGTRRFGAYRRYVKTRVLAHWATRKPAYRVTLRDGTELVAGGDHRFLTDRGWKYVIGTEHGGPLQRPHLTKNNRLLGIGATRNLRKRDLEGRAVKTSGARLGVVSIEPLGTADLYDITTETGDFLADGAITHNCYARPTHEYFGLSAGLDFETKIFVKEDAPALLRKALSSPKWEPKTIAMSGVTDAYQPIERKLEVTRGCLEVLAEFRNPVGIVTKSHLVTRDADLLGELAAHDAAIVNLSITSLTNEVQRAMEPRAASPARRLDAIRMLSEAGIPTGVMVAPVVPGLTDHELPAILEAAAEAGAVRAGWIMLRLPHGVKEIFEDWLERHFPHRKDKVLNRIRSLRAGTLNDTRFGSRMRGEGPFAEQVCSMFEVACRSAGLDRLPVRLSTAAFRRPPTGGQLRLFDP